MPFQNETRKAFLFAATLTCLTLLLVSFPLLNYVSVSLRFSQLHQQEAMRQYAQEVEAQIQAISPVEKLFLFPRSIIYKSALLNDNDGIIFSLIPFNIPYFTQAFAQRDNALFYKHILRVNRLGAHALVIYKEMSYSQVIFDLLVMIAIVLLGMFFISYLTIYSMLKPYVKSATRMHNFFDDVMHELKTPLGIIQLNIESLMDTYKDKRLFRSLAALSTLSTLYEDLEYLIKNKTIVYTKEYLCLSLFLEERIHYFEALSHSKHIAVHSFITPDIYFSINRIELQRIIDNTLTNAIKYSQPNRTILVRLDSFATTVVLCIEDQGIGIQDTLAIFQRHYRGDIYKGGFGIGLSIVKSICDKHGITIKVVSEVGKGSQFCYTFVKEESPPL